MKYLKIFEKLGETFENICAAQAKIFYSAQAPRGLVSTRSHKKVRDGQYPRNPYHDSESCKCGKRIFAKQRVVDYPQREVSNVLKHCNCDNCSNDSVEPTEDMYKCDNTDNPLKDGKGIKAESIRQHVETPKEHAVFPQTNRDEKTSDDYIVHIGVNNS